VPHAAPAALPEPPPARSRPYLAYAGPEEHPKEKPRGRLVGAAIALVVLVLGAAVLWRAGFRRHLEATGPGAVAQSYATALAVGDMVTQSQLATEGSKGLPLPTWLTIVSGRVEGGAAVAGDTATVVVELTMAPRVHLGRPAPGLVGALARPYPVTLVLKRQSAGWRVDQREFLARLRRRLEQQNPGVALPPWEP
jgi:hypothetical protein